MLAHLSLEWVQGLQELPFAALRAAAFVWLGLLSLLGVLGFGLLSLLGLLGVLYLLGLLDLLG